MDRIEEVAANLVKAINSTYEATGAFAVNSFDEFMSVHLQPEEFGKIIEGRETKMVRRGKNCGDYPWQREVLIGGIKFFCLLSEEERAELSQLVVTKEETPIEAVV